MDGWKGRRSRLLSRLNRTRFRQHKENAAYPRMGYYGEELSPGLRFLIHRPNLFEGK